MISNSEICNRLDVLYNNIMSLQAPGLDKYEKTVVFNKAQLEVVKSHLNPKGNKYAEGYDFTSKRQMDFSSLTVEDSFTLYPKRIEEIHQSIWVPAKVEVVQGENPEDKPTYNVVDYDINYQSMLSVLNESIDVVANEKDFYVNLASALMKGDARGFDFDGDGEINIGDVAEGTDAVIQGLLPKDVNIQAIIDYILGDNSQNGVFVLRNPKTPEQLITENKLKVKRVIVVPLSYIEYDTLMSRPYKYPPKSQAWRVLINGKARFVLEPEWAPYKYTIRYVRVPDEVDLSSEEKLCTLPDFLIDEVLQRAVELAKNSWEGNIETHKAFGERSE